MSFIGQELSVLYRVKRKLCMNISSSILTFYSRFRNCSGLQVAAKQKLEEYKRSEEDVKNVKRELPKIKAGIDELRNENEFFRSRLNYALYDLHLIKKSMNDYRYDDVISILNKYDFDAKIENKEIKNENKK